MATPLLTAKPTVTLLQTSGEEEAPEAAPTKNASEQAHHTGLWLVADKGVRPCDAPTKDGLLCTGFSAENLPHYQINSIDQAGIDIDIDINL